MDEIAREIALELQGRITAIESAIAALIASHPDSSGLQQSVRQSVGGVARVLAEDDSHASLVMAKAMLEALESLMPTD